MLSLGVSFARDTYFKFVVLLLRISNSVTGVTSPIATPYLADASTNNFLPTITGDVKGDAFNPYRGAGYYGTWLDGTTGYLTIANNASFNLSTNSFTMEAWVFTVGTTQITIMEKRNASTYDWIIYLNEVANYLTVYTAGIVSKGQATVTFPFGQWVHVAWVRNGTVFNLYQNGVSVYTTTNAAAATYNAAYPINIGIDNPGSGIRFYWPGYISNVRIVNGTAMYTGAFTPPTSPLTAVTGTVLLTCQYPRFIDASSLASTITVSGTVKIVPATPVMASLPATVSSYGSAYFDGASDYLTIANNVAFNFGSNNFTIECWVYPAVAGTLMGFIQQWQTGGQFIFRKTATNRPEFVYYTGSNITVTGTTTTVVPFAWNHVAVVRNGSLITMYVNGVADATTSTFAGSLPTTDRPVKLGVEGDLAGPLTGYISDARIVNGAAQYTTNFTVPTAPLDAVTNTQLLTLQYKGGANNYNTNDDGYFDHVVTRYGNASLSTFTPFSNTGFSMYFNGTTDAVNTTAPMPTSGDFTVECWFWLSSNLTYKGAGNYAARLFSGAATSVMEFQISGTSTDPTPQYLSATSYGNSNFPLSSAVINISIRDWHHVALVRSGSNNAIFLDGVRVATLSSSFAFTAANASIGGHASATNYLNWFPGYINNARIMNSAAYDPTQTTITVPTAPFMGNTTTTLLIGQDNRIVDQSHTRATITYSGTPQIHAVGPFGSYTAPPKSYSMYFGGAEYYSVPNNAIYNFGTGDFTIEWWQYLTGTSFTASNGMNMGQKLNDASNGWQIYRNTSVNTDKYSLRIVGGTDYPSTVTSNIKVWEHWAVVRSGTTLTWYKDGVAAGVYTGVSGNITEATAPMKVGFADTWSYYMGPGYYADVRIVSGTAVYTGAFTRPSAPLTAITNTSFLGCQTTKVENISTVSQVVTVVGSPKISPMNPYGLTTLTTPVPYQPTLHGGSLALDGTGDYLQLPQTAAIWNMSTYDFHIEAWVYPTARVTNGAYILVSSNYGVGTDFGFWILNAGTLQIYLLTGTVATSTAVVPLYQWTHVAVTKISNVYQLYVNGVKDNSVTLATTIPSTYVPTIGNSSNNTGTTYFPGFISGLKVNRGVGRLPYLTPFYPSSTPPTSDAGTILLCNFTSGGIIDNAMKTNYETVGGVQITTSQFKNGSGSIYFPGSSYLLGTTRAMLSLTSDFTIEFWVKGGAQAGIYPILLARNASYASGNFYLCFSHTSAANKISIHHTTYGSPFYQHPTTINDNVWHHVALVRTGGSIVLYVDGVGTTAYTGTGATVAWDYSTPLIGATPSDGSATLAQTSFNGYIDEFRITKYARYAGNFTPAALISQ